MTTKNSLLDHASIKQCEQLANGTDLHGKRAKALLLLNNGEINSAAAKKSGLTAGQLSYLLGRFKKVGMALFITASGQKIVAKKAVAKKAVPKTSVAKKSIKKAVVKKPAPVIDVEKSVKSNDDQELTGGDPKAEGKAKKKKDKKSSKKDKAKKASKKTKNSKGKKDKKHKKNKKSKKDKKGKKKIKDRILPAKQGTKLLDNI